MYYDTVTTTVTTTGTTATVPFIISGWGSIPAFDSLGILPEVDKIIINGVTTVVIWKDGTKTQSTAGTEDNFSPEVGFALCLMKKMFGKKFDGRPLYRRMVLRAQAQGDSKFLMDEYKQEVAKKEKQNRERKSKKKNAQRGK